MGRERPGDSHPLSAYVMALHDKMNVAALARWELQDAQEGQKRRYDAKVKLKVFEPGQKVLVLLPSVADKLLVILARTLRSSTAGRGRML